MTGDPESPAPPGPSLRPALFVVALFGLITAGGITVMLLTSGVTTEPAPTPTLAKIAGIAAESATPVLASIRSNGEPPEDVLGSLVLPTGTVLQRTHAVRVGQYDTTASCAAPATPAPLERFFVGTLTVNGWKIVSDGPVAGGAEVRVLGERTSSDGFYWEVGLTIDQSVVPDGTGPPRVRFSMRILEVPDAA